MILTGNEIQSAVAEKRITIDPFDRGLLNPNSYNYRLGRFLKIAPSEVLDFSARHDWPEVEIPSSGILLEPGHLYLGHTAERIGSHLYVTSLIGRSSVGRLGLYLQVSADLGHQGAVHSWTLELTAVQPLRIYPGMRIGQVSFWVSTGIVDLYGGMYGLTGRPTENQGRHVAKQVDRPSR